MRHRCIKGSFVVKFRRVSWGQMMRVCLGFGPCTGGKEREVEGFSGEKGHKKVYAV